MGDLSKVSSFTKVYLILWKNFTLHRRHKLRLLIEIVLPLVLFIILMAIRNQGLKNNMPECYFSEKALPSAGVGPFFQNTLCTFNNTCHQTEQKPVQYEAARVSLNFVNNLIDDLENIARKHVTQTRLKIIEVMLADFEAFSLLLKKLTDPYSKIKGTIKVSKILRDVAEVKNSLNNSSFSLSPQAVDSLLKSKFKIAGLQGLFDLQRLSIRNHLCIRDGISNFFLLENKPEWKKLKSQLCSLSSNDSYALFYHLLKYVDWESFYEELSNVTKVNVGMSPPKVEVFVEFATMVVDIFKELKEIPSLAFMRDKIGLLRETGNLTESLKFGAQLLQFFVCGRNSSVIFDPDNQGMEKRFEELKNDMKQSTKEDENNEWKYAYDNSTSSQCNAFFQKFEDNEDTRYLWRMFKPFIRGKILFTPVTKATRKIINKMNETFEPLIEVQEFLSRLIGNVSPNNVKGIGDASSNDSFVELLEGFIENINVFLEKENIDGVNSSHGLFNHYVKPNLEEIIRFLMSVANYMEQFKSYIECIEKNRFEGFSNEKEMVLRGLSLMEEKKFWAGVVFSDFPKEGEELPNYVRYKIRMDPTKVDSSKRVFDFFPKPGSRRRPTYDLKYFTFSFAYLQDIIEHAIIKLQTGIEMTAGVYVQQFPYPCYIQDQFILIVCLNFGFFMTVSWLYSLSMIIKGLVQEKELRLKEVMKMMGLENGVLWMAWFVEAMITMTISCILLSIILVCGRVLENSDPTLIFVYLISYCIATVSSAFLLSTLFSQANIAAVAGGTLFFLAYLPSSFLAKHYEYMSFGQKFATSLLPSCAFGMAAEYLVFLEESGEGAQWSNVGDSPLSSLDVFSFGHCVGMMLFDSVLFMLLACYIDAVFPGQYGIPRPWYYFLTKSFWCGPTKRLTNSANNRNINDSSSSINSADFEEEPTDLPLGVSIQDLTKIYSTNNKLAIDKLSLNFYENQITSFLGPNGSGKTTTLSMLIGLYPPTSGTAYVNGYSVTDEIDGVRSNLGVCPQHNVLFHGLTVQEHLWFYGRLKGATNEEVLQESKQLILDLGLENKKNELACNLSGGMQRKLSIGIAFSADSKTVILDEPTGGVDPYSRKSIWELLIKYKCDRTIILTTHHMDEADILGDRIAVIADGKLKCCGSSLFLKSRYGKGYYLTMVKAKKSFNENSNGEILEEGIRLFDDCVAEDAGHQMEKFVKNLIHDATVVENVGSDIKFLIPSTTSQKELLKLLEALEKQQNYLPISCYGISDSSFEDIFLQVSDSPDSWKKKKFADIQENDDNVKPNKFVFSFFSFIYSVSKSLGFKRNTVFNDLNENHVTAPPSPSKKVVGKKLLLNQFCALLIRRIHHTKRNYKGLFCEVALPAFFVFLSMTLSEFTPRYSEEPSLELHPWHFGTPNYVFFENLNSSSQITQSSVHSLIDKPGLGNRCVKNNPVSDFECDRDSNINYEYLDQRYNITVANNVIDCSCSLGGQSCPAGAGGLRPPSLQLSTTDILFNVTGRNISDWLLKTAKTYYKMRFGGFSFGIKNPMGIVLDDMMGNVSERFDSLWPKSLNKSTKNEFIKNIKITISNLQPVDNVKVWFNNRGWVSSVAFMNAVNNILLRTGLREDKDPQQYGISVSNHPMIWAKDDVQNILDDHGDLGFLYSICIIFALSFVPASFTIYLIEDKSTGSKHIQYVTGLKPYLYWLSSFIWDVIIGLIIVVLCLLIFLAFDEQAFVSDHHFSAFTTLLILYCFACIPLMYMASFLFDSASSAFITLSSINLFAGVLTTISIHILRMLDNQFLEDVSDVLDKIYLVFPHYCLGRGLMSLYSKHLVANAFLDYGLNLRENPFAWNFLGLNFFVLTLQGIVFFACAMAIDYVIIHFKRFSMFQPSGENVNKDDESQLEEDVNEEVMKVHAYTDPSESTLLIKDLTKIYDKNKPPAVNKLCLSVGTGQCFGLLGVNGAGKTSTFKILTGDTNVTSGDAFIGGYSVKSELHQACQLIGYCPQQDALDSRLTSLEHLEFYARIAGIPEKHVRSTAYWLIKKLGLSPYADVTAGVYSGGNKRKLSTAIALVGYPAVVFLDEPTTGMDAKSKRFLWNFISDIVKDRDLSVILTSHSMEEIEALCTRLAIMTRGQFRCIGSVQHLKTKFGAGYTVTIKVADIVEDVTESMSETFEDCATLQEIHLNQLHYHIHSSLQLSFIFRKLEELLQQSLIETYSVTQTTLEQVFINFAKESEDSISTSLQVENPSPKRRLSSVEERAPELSHLLQENGKAFFNADRETIV